MQKTVCQNKGKREKENDGVLGIQAEKGSWGGADSPWSGWISFYCWKLVSTERRWGVSLCMSFQIIFHKSVSQTWMTIIRKKLKKWRSKTNTVRQQKAEWILWFLCLNCSSDTMDFPHLLRCINSKTVIESTAYSKTVGMCKTTYFLHLLSWLIVLMWNYWLPSDHEITEIILCAVNYFVTTLMDKLMPVYESLFENIILTWKYMSKLYIDITPMI